MIGKMRPSLDKYDDMYKPSRMVKPAEKNVKIGVKSIIESANEITELYNNGKYEEVIKLFNYFNMYLTADVINANKNTKDAYRNMCNYAEAAEDKINNLSRSR